MEKNTHREPTLYIVGSLERKDEIRHIIEDEWGGENTMGYKFSNNKFAYYISPFGIVKQMNIVDELFEKAVANGWFKEYKLPKKQQFKPFDKVIVKVGDRAWTPALFGYSEDNDCWLQGYGWVTLSNAIILPYNEQTEKLIGTNDEWKGGRNDY